MTGSVTVQEVLTVARCIPHILCRGLVRIRCVHELPAVIQYLSLRHYINGGIVSGQIRDLYPSDTFRVYTSTLVNLFIKLLWCSYLKLLLFVFWCCPVTSDVFLHLNSWLHKKDCFDLSLVSLICHSMALPTNYPDTSPHVYADMSKWNVQIMLRLY